MRGPYGAVAVSALAVSALAVSALAVSALAVSTPFILVWMSYEFYPWCRDAPGAPVAVTSVLAWRWAAAQPLEALVSVTH